MNSRELLQRRRMLENGDTIWEDGIVVEAAKAGDLCVLDGVEHVHSSALEVLAPLIQHRHLDLPDGTRIVSQRQFDLLKQRSHLSTEQMNKRYRLYFVSSYIQWNLRHRRVLSSGAAW